ncbi:MAG: DUF4446 family protein [Anaerococcus sp.]|nr:DUF4446 family protein [Anaerococcus sp.]
MLTSIYGADGSTIYLKEITNGQAKFELSDHEEAVLKKAKG